MYSGSTLTPISGRIMGAHQKIDRVARKHLDMLLQDDELHFPSIKEILKFEGRNGPDGIKRKSPAQNEPWHYFNPFDESDNQLGELIEYHYQELSRALQQRNSTRAAFEAAWLAHAITDGLTPAHHYPYEAELEKLRGGEGLHTRTSISQKVIMPGVNVRDQMKNNWRMWGPKGLMSTHGSFEIGVATIIAPLSFKRSAPTQADIDELIHQGVVVTFVSRAREIAAMDMYHTYYKTGWSPRLAHQVRNKLVPEIIKTITLAWYGAAHQATLKNKSLSTGAEK